VLSQQRNWIGRSSGARLQFALSDQITQEPLSDVHVFTTRADTIFGVKYLALSMSHPLVLQAATRSPELQAFLDRRASFPPDSKEGFELPFVASNPVSESKDSPGSSLPVFAAPYVLDGYGEGAVMGVPAHDSRDLSFWKRNRPSDPVSVAIASAPLQNTQVNLHPAELAEAFTEDGILTPLCERYAGMSSKEARTAIISDLRERSGRAEAVETWRLRDWLVSRQRYWGTPIPIIHCSTCGAVPVPKKELPVLLPSLDSSIKGQTGNPLNKIEEWTRCKCPKCSGPARRETDTMDTFVDSSWYFMRFPDPANKAEPFSIQSARAMLPVDTYVGGVEHAILHLLYARFIHKFLCNEGLIPGQIGNAEPFQQLIAQGMVHGKTFSNPDNGRFLLPEEVEISGETGVMKSTGKPANVTWEKMSKSKHNGVDPSQAIEKFGADALRAHILFAAPVSEVLQWDEEKIVGIQRWFGRVNRLVTDLATIQVHVPADAMDELPDLGAFTEHDAKALLLAQETSASICQTFSDNIYGLNTAVSDLIKLTNGLDDIGVASLTPSVAQATIRALLQLMAPITPAFAEESWELLSLQPGSRDSIFDASWREILTPEQEATLRKNKAITCAVQVNGKVRFTVHVPSIEVQGQPNTDMVEKMIVDTALATEEGRVWLTEKNDWAKRKRIIVAGSGKVMNVVF
jgi:leucyl-tRNA synthetase